MNDEEYKLYWVGLTTSSVMRFAATNSAEQIKGKYLVSEISFQEAWETARKKQLRLLEWEQVAKNIYRKHQNRVI
jgi:hypothetical protein